MASCVLWCYASRIKGKQGRIRVYRGTHSKHVATTRRYVGSEKENTCDIKNEIGRIFRTHNLLEYKSPDDMLNYDVFLKGIAYAYLYKAKEEHVDEIVLDEMSLTFIRERKPVMLFKKLQKEKFIIDENGLAYII